MMNHRFQIPLLAVAATLLIAISSTATSAKATGPEAKKMGKGGARAAFNAGDNTLGFSVGLGSTYSYYGTVTSLPAFAINYDHGIVDNVGPGTIGIGGVLGFQSSYYNYSIGSYKATWTSIVFGVRGTYHLTILKDKNNKFDPYAGITIGYRSVSYKDDYYTAGNIPMTTYSTPYFGTFVGAKYNFSPNFGAFAEVGYDISFLRLGLHLNF